MSAISRSQSQYKPQRIELRLRSGRTKDLFAYLAANIDTVSLNSAIVSMGLYVVQVPLGKENEWIDRFASQSFVDSAIRLPQ